MAAVQDDRRENEMCSLLGLRKGVGRSEVDAYCDFEESHCVYSVPVELKSTTTGSVSTARDVGPAHIEKWRRYVWVFGFYDRRGKTLESLLILGPREMEPWIAQVELSITPDFALGERASRRLILEDLYAICDEKLTYSQEDAQKLHKKQWAKKQYKTQMDLPDGYSPQRMLDILRERSLYLSTRGSTLNNPHIPKTFFARLQKYRIGVEQKTDGEVKQMVWATIRAMALTEQRQDWILK